MLESNTTLPLGKAAKSQALPKRLIIMCGFPGAGKTTTAHWLRQNIDDAIVISRDYFRNPYVWNGRVDNYSTSKAEIIDRKFFSHVEEHLSVYTTIILDATFRNWMKRQLALDFGKRLGCQFFIIECICDHQTLLQRLRRQMLLGHKKFIKQPEEVLEYYVKSRQKPTDKSNDTNIIELDTERKKVLVKSLKKDSFQFVKQLIEILKQPVDYSLLDTFSTISFQNNMPTEETALLELLTSNSIENLALHTWKSTITQTT